MTISRATAQTLTLLITRVRREIGDPATTAGGTTIPVTSLRYSDGEITDAINDALIFMGTQMSIRHSGDALVYTDLTYTEGADNWGASLPSAINAEGVYAVADVTTPTEPSELFYLTPDAMLHIPSQMTPRMVVGRRYYTLVANPAATTYSIVVHPDASGRIFRLFWVATPFITGAAADQHLLSSRWREFIGLYAARLLMSTDKENTSDIMERYVEQLKLFLDFSNRQKHPASVKQTRRLY